MITRRDFFEMLAAAGAALTLPAAHALADEPPRPEEGVWWTPGAAARVKLDLSSWEITQHHDIEPDPLAPPGVFQVRPSGHTWIEATLQGPAPFPPVGIGSAGLLEIYTREVLYTVPCLISAVDIDWSAGLVTWALRSCGKATVEQAT